MIPMVRKKLRNFVNQQSLRPCGAIRMVLARKRYGFALRKVWFHRPKRMLLFVKPRRGEY